MDLLVRRKPGGQRHEGLMTFGNRVYPCSLGRSGVTTMKREGDGATPAGSFRLLYGFYRHDRLGRLKSPLPLKAILPDMGWCDAPNHPAYNSLVQLPFGNSHELMKREDRLYDVCIVLDYNIGPRSRGSGSAIFFHQSRPDRGPTEGCVAIDPAHMRLLLPQLSASSVMTVAAD